VNSKTMAARMIALYIDDDPPGDYSESPAYMPLWDSLIGIALGALRELAELRETSVEALLLDIVDSS
jgi:hypothetical protein